MRRALFLGTAGKHLLEVDPSERQARKHGSQTARTTLRARQQNETHRRLRGLQPAHRHYQQNGNRLTFGKIAMTFMACPEGMENERDFVTALEQVRSWKILGNHLELIDGS